MNYKCRNTSMIVGGIIGAYEHYLNETGQSYNEPIEFVLGAGAWLNFSEFFSTVINPGDTLKVEPYGLFKFSRMKATKTSNESFIIRNKRGYLRFTPHKSVIDLNTVRPINNKTNVKEAWFNTGFHFGFNAALDYLKDVNAYPTAFFEDWRDNPDKYKDLPNMATYYSGGINASFNKEVTCLYTKKQHELRVKEFKETSPDVAKNPHTLK